MPLCDIRFSRCCRYCQLSSHASSQPVQPKIDLYVDLHGHRDLILPAGFEPPLSNGFDRPLIQAHTQGTRKVDVVACTRHFLR